MKTDAIEVPDESLRELINDNPLQIELRGYEVAKLTGAGRWEMYNRYRPSEAGRLQAAGDARWLTERNPGVTYRVRALVSMNPPEPQS